MKIQVLGTGCKSCDTLYANAVTAIRKIGMEQTAQLEKINDIDYFTRMGVFTTPGLVVDGELISTGRVVSEEALIEMLTSRK